MRNSTILIVSLLSVIASGCALAQATPHLEVEGRLELDRRTGENGRARLVVESVYQVKGNERVPLSESSPTFTCPSMNGDEAATSELRPGALVHFDWVKIESKSYFGIGTRKCNKGQRCLLFAVEKAGLPVMCGNSVVPMYWTFNESTSPLTRSLELRLSGSKDDDWIRQFTASVKKALKLPPIRPECFPRVRLRFSWDKAWIGQTPETPVFEAVPRCSSKI